MENGIYDIAFERLMQFEGIYSDHPDDNGGKTKYGIADARDGKKDGMADLDGDGIGDKMIDQLTRSDAYQLFKREYWDKCKCDSLHPKIAFVLFDTAVNCGNGQAVKFLQRAVGVNDDGIIGPKTLGAACNISGVDNVVISICTQRILLCAGLPTWKVFGKGWTTRVLRLTNLALGA